jgi:hypothetical protein
MRLRTFIPRTLAAAAATAIAVLTFPGVANAKVAPASGAIDGDELAGPIDIDPDSGTGTSEPFFRLVEQAGYFAATMGLVPDPMLDDAPTSDLGPELVVTWQLDEHGMGHGALRQTIYPDAAGGPLTYTEPGQEYFPDLTAPGGWYRASAGIVGSLRALGVPEDALDRDAPPATGGFTMPWSWMVVGVVVLAAIGAGVFGARRAMRVRLTPT